MKPSRQDYIEGARDTAVFCAVAVVFLVLFLGVL